MKNSIFLYTIFFIVSLFITLGTNSLESAYNNNLEFNNLLSNKAKSMEIINGDKISGKEFISIIEQQENVFLQNEGLILGIYTGKSIYFNSDLNMKVPLVYGRFFTKEDFSKGKKTAVIGKNLKNQIVEIDSQKYIKFNSEYYSVIGFIGHENKASIFDDIFYINLDAMLSKYEDLKFLGNGWVLDSRNSDVEAAFNNINTLLKNKDKTLAISETYKETSRSYLDEIIENQLTSITFTIAVCLVLLLNVVNTTSFYISSKRKEIGVRKAFGATNFKISIKIIMDYELIASFAFISAFILYFIIINLKFFPLVFSDSIFFFSSFMGFIIILIIGILTSLVAISKSLKLEPSSIMKGR